MGLKSVAGEEYYTIHRKDADEQNLSYNGTFEQGTLLGTANNCPLLRGLGIYTQWRVLYWRINNMDAVNYELAIN